MSYRDCRNLCEMLRSLNYGRIISLENFMKPNFELVADILYWLAQKYDPQANISDDINEEKDRVEFIKGIVTLFSVKARIKLNPKKLYQADGETVQEILKIISVLYQASSAKSVEEEEAAAFNLPLKVSNLKAHKVLANEICDLGARLYDAISKEPELKKTRLQALAFLEGMNGVNEGDDQAYIENSIKTIMQQQAENTGEMTKYVQNMEHEQKQLKEKLKKKSSELELVTKRYQTMISTKPPFMEEYERLEAQLARFQEVYVNKYRNLDFLENELEIYNKMEAEKAKKAKNALEKARKEAQKRENEEFRGEDELEEAPENEDDRAFTRGQSRREKEIKGDLQEEEDSEDGDDSEDDGESGQEIDDENDDSDF